jgi:hypothetical protein
LLPPWHVKHVSALCLGNATHVYRPRRGRDTVRMPALQIIAETGCTCQACKHT